MSRAVKGTRALWVQGPDERPAEPENSKDRESMAMR